MNDNLFEPVAPYSDDDRRMWDYASGSLRALAAYLDQQAAQSGDLGAKVAFQHASREALRRADIEFRRSRP